jgi:flagellar basal-body rod protein FlgG
MSQPIYELASRAVLQELRLDVLSNNLANINTTGFKEDLISFNALSSDADAAGQGSSDDSGDTPLMTVTSFSPGQMRYTQNDLDLAIEGDGFFCVRTPEGMMYTRKGCFGINNKGQLVTQEGELVIGKKGEITITGTSVSIDESGNVLVDGVLADELRIVGFEDSQKLQKVTNSLFKCDEPEENEKEANDYIIKQGFLELSNVNTIKTMTEMIDVLRGYESYQKVIQFMDDATMKAINDVGRLT